MQDSKWSTAQYLWIFGVCALLDIPLGFTCNWLAHHYDSDGFAIAAGVCAVSLFFCTTYFCLIVVNSILKRVRR